MTFGPASRLGVARFEETPPVELLPGRSEEEVNAVIAAVYRQVFGNAYLMESERPYQSETQLKSGDISVREFVRQVAKSDAYRSRFFDTCPRYRYTELTTKHLLGRAPDNFEETKYHSGILDTEGFGADIDAYIDSDEYQEKYGEMTVPFYTGYKTQTGKNMVGFTRMFKMLRGASSSDYKGSIIGKSAEVYKSSIQGTPLAVVAPSDATPGWSFQDPAVSARSRHGVGASEGGKVFRVEVTAYRSKAVNRVSKFRRSNQVYLVPLDRLSDEYKRIHRQGGVIASITPVS
ncbi:MAG: phycobilisome rod-core linker polypeptide [Cyanophyceae cyanobacterium]